jgi:protein TonB
MADLNREHDQQEPAIHPREKTEESMFEKSLLESTSRKLRTQTKWYFLVAMLAYFFILSSFIAGGILLANPQIKEQLMSTALVASPPPPPPGPPSGKRPMIARAPKALVIFREFEVPTVIPRVLPPTIQEDPRLLVFSNEPSTGTGSGGAGVKGGVEGSVWDSPNPISVIEPPPPPKEDAPPPAPKRVSGGVLQGTAIRRVQPVYPPIARSARVSGTVEVEVVIDETGNVISAAVVQGHPLLTQAALDAAGQWKFRPTLLSQQAIKVTGVLIFNFRL